MLRVSLVSKTGGWGENRQVSPAPPSQGKGSPRAILSAQSQGPTRRQAAGQPRPDPAPGRARGLEEGPGRAVPSGSVPRARGRGRGPSTSPAGVTNGLGTQTHATFQPKAGMERADTPHSTPAKVGRRKGGPGAAPSDLQAVFQTPNQPALTQTPDARPSPSSGRRGQAGLARIIRHAMSFHSAKAASAPVARRSARSAPHTRPIGPGELGSCSA